MIISSIIQPPYKFALFRVLLWTIYSSYYSIYLIAFAATVFALNSNCPALNIIPSYTFICSSTNNHVPFVLFFIPFPSHIYHFPNVYSILLSKSCNSIALLALDSGQCIAFYAECGFLSSSHGYCVYLACKLTIMMMKRCS